MIKALSGQSAAVSLGRAASPAGFRRSGAPSAFAGKLEATRLKGLAGEVLQADVAKTERDLLNGKQLSAKDLLVYQIKAGELNLRVELLSKLADAVISITRRLQQS